MQRIMLVRQLSAAASRIRARSPSQQQIHSLHQRTALAAASRLWDNPRSLSEQPCVIAALPSLPFSNRTTFTPTGRYLNQQARFFSTHPIDDESDDEYLDQHEIPSDVYKLVQDYASRLHTAASIDMLTRTGSGSATSDTGGVMSEAFMGRMGKRLAGERVLIQMASWLQQEIPIRLAARILDLQDVPLMRHMPSVQAVKTIYVNSFLELLEFNKQHPVITTSKQEESFAHLLESLYRKHSSVLVQMAKGAYELRSSVRQGSVPSGEDRSNETMLEFERMQECHAFLDRFYMSRIGIRVLAGQYLALREQHYERMRYQGNYDGSRNNNSLEDDDYVGMICLKTSPSEVVRAAANDAQRMCRRRYGGRAPQVEIIEGRHNLTFPYIPTYLHYILLELLKNALRATCETHLGVPGKSRRGADNMFNSAAVLPKVTVIIADGQDNEDVVIKISDEGGGIRRSQLDRIWSWLFTTADQAIQDSFIGENNNVDHDHDSPIAGLGYGLPISRLYVKYFGGCLDLVSMEGYGTDAFVHMKRLGDSKEPIVV